MRDKEIVEKIYGLVRTLDEIDNYVATQNEELSKIDLELSDWTHFIENNDFGEDISHKVVIKIRELRRQRRSLCKEQAIEDTYKNNASKVMGNNTRQFLIAEIEKTIKQLDSEYKNRVITEEDIQELYTTTKKKVGRPKKVVEEEIL
jgi:hypothetical protein